MINYSDFSFKFFTSVDFFIFTKEKYISIYLTRNAAHNVKLMKGSGIDCIV